MSPLHAARTIVIAVLLAISSTCAATVAHAEESGPDKRGTTQLEATVPTEKPAPPTPPDNKTPPAPAPPAAKPPTSGTTWGQGTTAPAPSATPASGDPAAPKEPAIGNAPGKGEAGALDKSAYAPGAAVRFVGEGFTPGEMVQVVLFGDGTLVGNYEADADGKVSVRFELPKDIKPGSHTLQMTGWASKRIVTATVVIANDAALAAGGGEGNLGTLLPIAVAALAAAALGVGGWYVIGVMRRRPSDDGHHAAGVTA